jgi:hypothetical protein
MSASSAASSPFVTATDRRSSLSGCALHPKGRTDQDRLGRAERRKSDRPAGGNRLRLGVRRTVSARPPGRGGSNPCGTSASTDPIRDKLAGAGGQAIAAHRVECILLGCNRDFSCPRPGRGSGNAPDREICGRLQASVPPLRPQDTYRGRRDNPMARRDREGAGTARQVAEGRGPEQAAAQHGTRRLRMRPIFGGNP